MERQGYRLDFTGNMWRSLNRKTRNRVRRGASELYIRPGNLDNLRRVHWEPVYLPRKLEDNQKVYVAVLSDMIPPISAVLVEERGDYVYYKYSGNSEEYRVYQGNSYLLWWIAEYYKLQGYKYLDLGGSNQPSIERFKKSFSTSSYLLEDKPKLWRKIKYHIKKAFYGF